MKLDAALIRQEREKRAWSQEHLAGVTGLALRTIQRIESTGSASYESAGAIAAVFDLPVSALRDVRTESTVHTGGMRRWLTWHRLFTVLGCGLVSAVFLPPNFHMQIPAAVAFWVGCELAILTRRNALPIDS
ncbi:MAG TPA: helix-turn-helix transcriptional regulator [Steroidobacteraceae bacterium]